MENTSLFSPYRLPEGGELDSSLGVTPERPNNDFKKSNLLVHNEQFNTENVHGALTHISRL